MITYESLIGLPKKEQRSKINNLIDYFIAEGVIIEDPVSGKIRLTTDEELNAQIENI
jgi:hypothetical protein